jgi:hypothetical protein
MRIKYECSICGRIFDGEQAAIDCEQAGVDEPIVSVGQLVVVDPDNYGRFGWFDGDSDWVIKKPTGLHSVNDWDGDYYSLIYVVTHIDSDGHWPRYHLETKGMTKDYRKGVTFAKGHYTPRGFEGRELDGSDLIGNKVNWLL